MSEYPIPTAESAEQHLVMKRRTRKGSRNDLVIRRGAAHVIGSDLPWHMPRLAGDPIRTHTSDGHPLEPVVSPRAAEAVITLAVRRGRNGGGNSYDLVHAADAMFREYGLEPMLGGVDIAYAQLIHADRADVGADIHDAIAVCAHRDDLAGWATTDATRQAFRTADVGTSGASVIGQGGRHKVAWPTRLRVSVSRARSERDRAAQAGLPTVDALPGPIIGTDGHPDARGRRVFIGGKLSARRTAVRGGRREARTADSWLITDQTTPDLIVGQVGQIAPGARVTFRTPHLTGTITRGTSGALSYRDDRGTVLKGTGARRVARAMLAA